VSAIAAGVPTNSGVYDWRIYDNIFDDFHYDIGHGKGLGEGSISLGPVVDGYGHGHHPHGPHGDHQIQYGSPTVAWESPGHRGRF
jgi:hypothetical protein